MKPSIIAFLFSIAVLYCLGQEKKETSTLPKDAIVFDPGRYIAEHPNFLFKLENRRYLRLKDPFADLGGSDSVSPEDPFASFKKGSEKTKEKAEVNPFDLVNGEEVDPFELAAELEVMGKTKPFTVAFVVAKDTYDIPINEVKSFIKDMPNAKELNKDEKAKSTEINAFGYVIVFSNWKYIALGAFIALLVGILLWYLIKKIMTKREVISSIFQKTLIGIKSAINWKVGLGFALVVVLLAFTNPSLTAFKSYAESEYPQKAGEYHKAVNYRYYSRQSYWLVFSRYQVKVACDEYAEKFKTHNYTGIFNNFFLDSDDKWKGCELVQ